MAHTLRVLHCPTTTGGNAQALARAEREIGLDSRCVAFSGSRYHYPVDELLWRSKERPWTRELQRWRFAWQVPRKYDIVHFNFGCSLMPQRISWQSPDVRQYHPLQRWLYAGYARLLEQRDLAWLTRAGVGIVVTYQGDDARQGDYCRRHFAISPADGVEPGYYSDLSDAQKRRRIAKFDRYADRIYAVNPDLLHVLPARAQFIPYASVDPGKVLMTEPRAGLSTKPVVVHAPTHRGVKGTRLVLEAVERLHREKDVNFEFLLVENLPHDQARKLYEQGDLLVDQLLAGWYGALAVEFMALGKPVISYLRQEDLHFLPEKMRTQLPIINATPDTIYSVLRQWLTVQRGELFDLGRRSRAYVETWHDPLKIATQLKDAYEQIALAKDQRLGVSRRR